MQISFEYHCMYLVHFWTQCRQQHKHSCTTSSKRIKISYKGFIFLLHTSVIRMMRQMIRMLRADRRAMTRILSASVRLFLWVGIPETETSSVMVLVCMIFQSFRCGDFWTAEENLWLKQSLILPFCYLWTLA